MNAKEFDDILNECLERLSKGETTEKCLASHPEHAAELEPLLRTALVARKASTIMPSADFRSRARLQFRQALFEAGQPKPHHFFGWQPRWATVAIAVLILVVAGSGTIAAANNAMPDEALYPVKLTAERVQVALTPSDAGKAQVYAQLADKRVAEIIKMANKGKPEQVEKTTERLDTNLKKVAKLATPEGKAATLQAPAAPSSAPTPTPAATPRPTPAPTQARPPAAASPTHPSTPGQAKSARDETAKNAAAQSERLAKVKAVVAENAANHQAALKATLKTAPESVKTALRRAIDVSDADYQQVLDALDK